MRNILFSLLFIAACAPNETSSLKTTTTEPSAIRPLLDLSQANRLAKLPLHCIGNPLPYKPGHTIEQPSDLQMPQELHPSFYGCFDWHSAVHGHWSLVYLMKNFDQLEDQNETRAILSDHLTNEKIQKELDYFSLNNYTKSFERTYGWAWLLKLQEELFTWQDEQAQGWYQNLQPLASHFSQAYQEYLPKLIYPIRVGEHSNTAFGLSFAYDYAVTVGDSDLKNSIEENAKRFYQDDASCPIDWEPSGYDFLSPCLQEIDIMRKVLTPHEFDSWLARFLPELNSAKLDLSPGRVLDRSDGKLVHLDGVNFSRAWCLYPLTGNSNAQNLADKHMTHSLEKITDGNYAGEHWLASFALYAFSKMEN